MAQGARGPDRRLGSDRAAHHLSIASRIGPSEAYSPTFFAGVMPGRPGRVGFGWPSMGDSSSRRAGAAALSTSMQSVARRCFADDMTWTDVGEEPERPG